MKMNKMASIAIMIGGALINATAIVGGSYLAKYLSGDQNIVKEKKKRDDLAVEKYLYRIIKKNRTKALDWIALMTKSRSRQEEFGVHRSCFEAEQQGA